MLCWVLYIFRYSLLTVMSLVLSKDPFPLITVCQQPGSQGLWRHPAVSCFCLPPVRKLVVIDYLPTVLGAQLCNHLLHFYQPSSLTDADGQAVKENQTKVKLRRKKKRQWALTGAAQRVGRHSAK